MSVHLKDIAEYTGVSIKTVSNVINGNYARVGEKTRQQILEAIEKLNYRPNIAARHLRKARTGVVALALPYMNNPYFSDVSNAIVAAAAEQSYTVLIDFTRGDRASELNVIKGLRPHLLDGIILDAQALDIADVTPDSTTPPIVLLGERLFGAPYDHVLIDNEAAAYEATKHLLSLGRQRIAVIGTREMSSCEAPSLRTNGYLKALMEYHYQPDEHILVDGGTWSRADGALAMRNLLALNTLPDAVLCFNDLLALGAMSVIHEAGLRIPEDIAIVGIDDIEDGHYTTPTLTSIAPNKAEIGRVATNLLIERIQGTRTQAPERVYVPFQLHIRQSTIGRMPASQ